MPFQKPWVWPDLSSQQKYQHLARARGLSEVGNALRQVILALAIFSVRQRQEDLFFSEVLESSGYLLMSIVAPFFIDQVRKLRALIVTDFLSLLNALLLIVAVTQKNLTLLFLGSFFMTFISSLYSSVLFTVTAKYSGAETSHIRRGLGYLQRNVLIGGMVGLLGATFMIPKLPLVAFLILDAGTFLLSSFWIFLVTRTDLRAERSQLKQFKNIGIYFSSLWSEWQAGLRSVSSHAELLKIFLMNFIICFGYGVLESSVVSTQKLVLGFSDSLVTFSRALNRVSAISGTMLLGRWSTEARVKRSRSILSFGFIVSSMGTALMLIPNALTFILSNSFYNLGWASFHPTIGALVARSVAPDYLGRVQSFRSLVINISILLGNLAVLFLSRAIPVQWLFALSCGCFLFTFLTFRSYKFARD